MSLDGEQMKIVEALLAEAFEGCQTKLEKRKLPNTPECMVACAAESIGIVSG